MRKYFFLLTFLLLCPFGASAAEGPACIGLAVTGEAGQTLLDGLAERSAGATFFPEEASWEQGKRILDAGHEIGLNARESWNHLSRRRINRELNACRALLPSCRVRLLRPEGGVSDGVRQVAEAKGMRFLENALDPWAEAPAGRSLLDRIQPGDILLLEAENPELSLNLVDLLQSRGYRLVTVSELYRLLGKGFDRGGI